MREVLNSAGDTFEVHAPDIGEWAEIGFRSHPVHGDTYVATVTDEQGERVIGELRYIIEFPQPGIITVGGLWSDPEYRGRGVATALIAALHSAYPEDQISPGAPPDDGMDFVAHLLEVEPEVRAAAALVHPTVTHLEPLRSP